MSKKALILFSLFFLALIILKNHASSVRIGVINSSAPVLKSFHDIPLAFKRMLPFGSFREENALLRKRVEYLTMRLNEAKLVSEENKRLKVLLDFGSRAPYATIAAQVIGRDPSNWSNSIIIDKGLSHGIRQNKAVLSVRGLVGRVVEVGRISAKVLLISDPNSKVGVVVQRNRQGGILVGRPDSRCKMIYIALDSDVASGDRVITAGLGSVFPPNMLVGEIVKVYKEPGRLYKSAAVRPAQDLSKVEEVLCLR